MFDYQKTFGGRTTTIGTREEFERIVSAPEVEKLCKRAQAWKEEEHRLAEYLKTAPQQETESLLREKEQAHEEAAKAKSKLPKFLFHATFPRHRRKSDEGVPTGLFIYDWDGIWEVAPQEVFDALLLRFKQEGRDFIREARVLLVHVTPSGHGLRLVCKADPTQDIKTNQHRLAEMMEVPQAQRDEATFDLARISYGVPMSYVLYLNEELWNSERLGGSFVNKKEKENNTPLPMGERPTGERLYQGIPYAEIIQKYWDLHNGGQVPVRSNRNTLTFELACNLRHICGFDRELLGQVIPCYDGFTEEEKMQCIDNALKEEHGRMPRKVTELIRAIKEDHADNEALLNALRALEEKDENYYIDRVKSPLPMGVADSLQGVHRNLGMAVLTGIGPMIGALATGVKLRVHQSVKNLNLIAYIVGEAASNKSELDELYYAWMGVLLEQDKLNLQKEDEFEELKRKKKNAKEQPERPDILVRCPSLRTSVTKILERLKYSKGKHLYSYTSESDQLSQSSKESWNNTSVILRKAYDGAEFSQAYKSDSSVNAVIDHVLWNLTLCCTPDALYRAIPNVTDGKLTRICIGRTPDNTFSPLELTEGRTEEARKNIRAVAEVLDVMRGELTLPLLQQRCEAWLERVRVYAQKNFDVVEARQRFRIAVSTCRYVAAFMLCDCAGWLIGQIDRADTPPAWAEGAPTAKAYMEKHPEALPELMQKFQTDSLLDMYDVLADYFLDNTLLYFRQRIENAYQQRNYVQGSVTRKRRGQNDTVYERLPEVFTDEEARREKGADATTNAVAQMLKNWRNQGLIAEVSLHKYRKTGIV